MQAELTLDEILLNIRDRMMASAVELSAGVAQESSDVMLDPQVDIRRHLSPSLLSASSMLPSYSGLPNGTSTTSSASAPPKRSKSYPKLRSLHPDRSLTE